MAPNRTRLTRWRRWALLLACLQGALLTSLQGAQDPAPPLPPEPDPALQKEADKWVHERYKSDYAKKSPADLQSLAHKLLLYGSQVTGDLPVRFVLLREARDLAVKSGDLDIALSAVDELAKSFAVDWGALRMAVLVRGSATLQGADAGRTLALAYLDVAEFYARKDSYDPAQAALTKGEAAAKGSQDTALLAFVQERRTDLKAVQQEYSKVRPEIEKKGDGDLLAVGRFFCLVKDDWDRGLPLLEQCSSPELKNAAVKDRTDPKEPMARAEIGDLWWELGATEKFARYRDRLQARAVRWYRLALKDLTGKVQSRTDERIKGFESRSLGTEVECVPGVAYRTRGLTLLPSAGDGLYELGMRKGRPCALMLNNGTDGRCLYFDIADGWAEKEGGVDIVIEYFDGASGTSLYLDYYPSEQAAIKELPKSSDVVTLGGSNTWKTATFRVATAYFRNRFVNSDFRIVSIGANVAVHRVVVRRK
jgi:hypothetical protein